MKPKRSRRKGLLPLGLGLLAGLLLFVLLIINPFSGRPPEPAEQAQQPPPPEGQPPIAQMEEAQQPQMDQPTDESVLLDDDFSDPSSGFTTFGEPGSFDVGYANNAFRIAFEQTMGFHASWSADDYGDAIVETAIDIPQGVDVGAGLQLRASPDNWYLVYIFPNSQEYSISKTVNGQFTMLVERRFSDAIQPYFEGGRALFRMRVRMLGDRFTVELADYDKPEDFIRVDEITDSDLSAGRVGLLAQPPQADFDQTIEVYFYYIEIRQTDVN